MVDLRVGRVEVGVTSVDVTGGLVVVVTVRFLVGLRAVGVGGGCTVRHWLSYLP